MYGSSYVFSKPFFTGWVTVGIIWIFISFGIVGLYPLWESRATIVRVCTGIVTGRRPNAIMQAEPVMTDGGSGTITPIEKEAKENVQ